MQRNSANAPISQHDLLSELQVHLPYQGAGYVRKEIRQPADRPLSTQTTNEARSPAEAAQHMVARLVKQVLHRTINPPDNPTKAALIDPGAVSYYIYMVR